MLYDHPHFMSGLAFLFVLVYLVARIQYVRSSFYKLRHIPTVGSSGIVSSYFASYRYSSEGHLMVQEGYKKYYGTLFKIPTMTKYTVVVSSPQLIDDIRRAGPELSSMEATIDTMQTDYTLGKQLRLEKFQNAVVRTTVTRKLASLFPEIVDEIVAVFPELISPTKDWSSVPARQTLMHIACIVLNRFFVGLPLCRDLEYRKLQEQFAIDAFEGGHAINKWPRILKPIVGRIVTKLPKNLKRMIKHVGPIIEERLAMRREHIEDKSDDLISWMIDEAPEQSRTVEDIALRVLATNFASIYATTGALTEALFDLAVYPEYVKPLREEVEAVIAAGGWTKVSLGKMRKLDSFLKESKRLTSDGLSISRKAMKDFTFSNGVTVPAGTHISIATRETAVDEKLLSDPTKFNGFRSSDKQEEEGGGMKHQMVTVSNEYLSFGCGRHACPGRFLATTQIKAMFAHILMNYDVKIPNDGPRPQGIWCQATYTPNPTAELLFRKRLS